MDIAAGGVAMAQTESTSHADQADVSGASAVRVLGALLILQGGYRLYLVANTVMLVVQRGIVDPSVLFLPFFLTGLIGLLTIVAGILLVRLDRAGRSFGLVVCSLALAHQVVGFASVLMALKFNTPSVTSLSGMLFWLMPSASTVLFLVGIILIARWHPPRLPG
jgi:hypothetical protein